MINMAVNLGIFPSKGMTLPFICYGGSSLIALGIVLRTAARADAAQPLS